MFFSFRFVIGISFRQRFSFGVVAWLDLLSHHLTGVYAHQERAARVADSCMRVGSLAQLIVLLPGTVLKSGGGTEGERAG